MVTSKQFSGGQLFYIRTDDIHKKYRIGYALGKRSPQTYYYCQECRAEAEYYLAPSGRGRCNVIGCHKDSADKKSAREYLRGSEIKVKASKEEHKYKCKPNEGYGNVPRNYLVYYEIYTSRDKSDRTDLTNSSAVISEEEIEESPESAAWQKQRTGQ